VEAEEAEVEAEEAKVAEVAAEKVAAAVEARKGEEVQVAEAARARLGRSHLVEAHLRRHRIAREEENQPSCPLGRSLLDELLVEEQEDKSMDQSNMGVDIPELPVEESQGVASRSCSGLWPGEA